MPAAGDLVFQIAADEKRLLDGIKRAESAAQSGGSRIKSAFSGGAISQASYGVQDFASVLMQGGERSLSRAVGSVTNNISMMGAAFGPWGIAVTTGIALATQFGIAMWESASGTESATEKLKEYATATDEAASKLRKSMEFGQRLRDLQKSGSSKQVEQEIQNARDRRAQIDEEIRLREQRMSQQVIDKALAGGDPYDFTEQEKKANDAENKKLAELRDEKQRMMNREAALEKAKPAVREREEEKRVAKEQRDFRIQTERWIAEEQRKRQREETQAFKERTDAIKRIEQETKTPEERFAERVSEIRQMFGRGDISEETAGRAFLNARGVSPREQATQGALIAGSSEAVSAVLRAEAERSKGDDAATLMRQFVEETKELKRIMQQVEKNTSENAVVEIGG